MNSNKALRIDGIKSAQLVSYKRFLTTGLIDDEENFRISPADEAQSPFPTSDKPDSFTLGAYVEDSLAGVVSFARDGADREKLRHKGILFRMYVAPGFRGLGIGKKLIEELLVRVRQIPDIEQVNLTVIANNATAKALYERFGFRSFAVEEHAIKWKGKYFAEEQMVLRVRNEQ